MNHRRDLRQGRGFAMSAFPLTRRAAARRSGARFAGGRRSERAGAAQRPVPQHCGRRLAVARQHGRSDGRLGAAGASRRARPGLGRLHARPATARRDPGGADRRSLSRAEQRRDRPVGRFAGHDQRHAPGQGPAWGGRRPTRPSGRSLRTTRWPSTSLLRVESNHWRVVALAQAFAGWAPRELGL